MMDDQPSLHETLARLHAQLTSASSLDPEARRLLEQVLEDIRVQLDNQGDLPNAADQPEESIAHRLAESARHFEETHPNLFGAIGSVIDALSRMGI